MTLLTDRPVRGPAGDHPDPRARARREDVRLRRAMLAPLVTLLLLLTVFPTLYAFWLSLTDRTGVGGDPRFIGLGNYVELLGSPEFWTALRVTLVFTVAAVVIELVVGLTVAMALNGLRREHRLLRAALLLPMAATPVAVLFGWKVILDPTLGVLNYFLDRALGISPDWLGTPTGALLTLVMVDVWQWTPFVMIILVGGLATLSRDTLEAALIDGADWWARLRYVIIPHLRPFLVVALLFRGIDALKTFDSIQVLTGGGPGNATTTLNMLAFRNGLQFLNLGRAAAIAILLLIVAILFGNLAIRALSREAAR